MVVVEVRQGTLGGDGRGWGPAGNTGRGWSWLRSDRDHCASRVAVEQEEEERRGGEEQATDIKSNNPHLAGGEQQLTPNIYTFGNKLNWDAKQPYVDAIHWVIQCYSYIYIYLSLSLPLSHSCSTCPRLLLGNNMTCNFCFRPIVLNHALWSTDAPRLCALQGNNGPLLKVRPWSVLPQHEFERLSDAFCGLSAPKPTQVLGYLVVPFSAKKWPIQF